LFFEHTVHTCDKVSSETRALFFEHTVHTCNKVSSEARADHHVSETLSRYRVNFQSYTTGLLLLVLNYDTQSVAHEDSSVYRPNKSHFKSSSSTMSCLPSSSASSAPSARETVRQRKRESKFLMAHQHKTGHSVPLEVKIETNGIIR